MGKLPTRRWTALPSAFALASMAFGGCGGSEEGPPERHRNDLASIDEGAIIASLTGNDIEVRVPLELLGDEELRGNLRVKLIDVSAGEPREVASGYAAFEQLEKSGAHVVVISGAGAGLERSETGTLVLDWSAAIPSDDLYGKKSLFAALGSLDVQVRGPSQLEPGATSPLRVIVRDPQSREFIEGANVEVSFVTETQEEGAEEPTQLRTPLFSAVTDALGEVAQDVSLPASAEAGSIRIDVTHGEAQVWATHSISVRQDNLLYLGTDKTIYKPGQDIHLRLLALDAASRSAIADADVTFEAKDGKGNKVFRRTARTDSFGVASIVVPTDSRVNEGDWAFSADIAGRTTQIRIPVEAYTLPKIRVDVAPEGTYALPGDTIRAHLSANYLFGEPVRNGSVVIDARTTTGQSIGYTSGNTDAEGNFDFELQVPSWIVSESLEDSGDTILFSATITDTAGQSERGEGQLALAAAPLRIQAIADGSLTQGAESHLFMVVSDAIGRPLRASLEIAGIATEETAQATDETGLAEVAFVPSAENTSLTVEATDDAGRTHARTFNFATASAPSIRIETDKAVYESGETANIHVSAPRSIARVYVDAYRGAKGVLSTAVDMHNGEGDVTFPISSDLGGLLVIDTFALGEMGSTLRSARPILVRQDSELSIELEADRETYAPGEEATLEVSVRDSAGNPQVASVGLTAVDEAVFALGGEPKTSILAARGLDEQVLPSTTRVGSRGAADLLGSLDAHIREQLARALFASAGNVRSPNFDYNSYTAELPAITSSLQAKLTYDAQALIRRYSSRTLTAPATVDSVRAFVRHRSEIDPFGIPYRLETEGSSEWDLNLVITSNGPDERPATADDVTARVSLSEVFYKGGRGEVDFEAAGGDWDNGAPTADPQHADRTDDTGGGGASAKVRKDFRETAYVNPSLITDATGRARVSIPLAESITTWRLSADASTAGGRIGSSRASVRTFQKFFVDFTMPTKLTRGDELELPAVVYNYLSEPVSVEVAMERGDWFELGSSATQTVNLGPSEVRAVKFAVRITEAGEHALTIRAQAGDVGDALSRSVDVVPDGVPEDQSFSGELEGTRNHVLTVPSDTVEGGASLELVLTPGFASEAVQGVESLMQEPTGCFEQTTSSAWPNTLVANYLEDTGQMTAEKRESTIALVTRGYQRLLTFESPTRGFNWWGDSDPGNRILSAIMLWHLKDLESLIEIDPAVRDRTLDWLLSQQNADGSWDSGDALHAGNEVLGTSKARTTAFIAWALAHTGWADEAAERAAGWLRTNVPEEADLYANALAANAFAFIDPNGGTTSMLFGRLDRAKEDRGENGLLWPTETQSWTGASGDAAAIETTGLVAYALLNADASAENAAGAMRFIVSNKDSVGTWYNTQATMNALRALSAAAKTRESDAAGSITVRVNGDEVERISIDANNRDLYRRFDLTDYMSTEGNFVELALEGEGSINYRLTRRAYRPALPSDRGPLSMTLSYDRTMARVGESISTTAQVTNTEQGARDQVIVQIGRAPGFSPDTDDLQSIVASGLAARYEVRESDVTFYLMNLRGDETRTLSFRMTPGLEVDATAPASRVYAYYEPSIQQTIEAQRFVVLETR